MYNITQIITHGAACGKCKKEVLPKEQAVCFLGVVSLSKKCYNDR